MYLVLYLFFLSCFFQSCNQEFYTEGEYIYNDLSMKSDLQSGTIFKFDHDKTVFLNTYFHITGQKNYKGKWELLNNNSVRIFDLQDINGKKPLNRLLIIETFQSRINKEIQIVLNDDAKFTRYFPAKLIINDSVKYFIKYDDTLYLTPYKIWKIKVKVEDFEDSSNINIQGPMLIKLSVKNNSKSSLYYYFKEIILELNNGKLYYNGVKLKQYK